MFSAIIAAMTGCKDEAANMPQGAELATTSERTSKDETKATPLSQEVNTLTMDPTEAAIKNMTPGPEHKELAASEGRWETSMTYWDHEGATPTVTKGTCEMKMVLGGRYQQSIYKGNVNGTEFEGIGYVAYDNAKKMFVNTWIDNMGTGILYLEGAYDANSNSTEMVGKCMDPATCRQKGMRQITKNLDENTQVMEMYETPENGREYKTMEIRFAKR
ncbi:hypothetical protein GCM10023093_28430 [Nemorincola caseinilytica]|uniref:DUF1579 domain-containing protein n=1 Tax=Nemorincola caseinilytica TaxID=2054315 RepID=A0ABP8NLZ0_9BACT